MEVLKTTTSQSQAKSQMKFTSNWIIVNLSEFFWYLFATRPEFWATGLNFLGFFFLTFVFLIMLPPRPLWGRVSPLGPEASDQSKCEKFAPFASLILKTHFNHCEGSYECIFHHLYASAIPLTEHIVTEQQQAEKRNDNSWCWIILLFSGVKSVSEHI